MAAITGATTTTSLTELIPPEQIGEMVQEPGGVGRALHAELAWLADASGRRGPVYRFPRWNAINTVATEDSPLTEADDGGMGSAIEITTDEASATAVRVGHEVNISYEAFQDAGQELAAYLRRMTQAMETRISTDMFLNIPTATNTEDFTGTPANIDRFGALYTGFKGQDAPMEGRFLALALHTDNMGQLRDAIRSSNSSLVRDGHGADLFRTMSGYQGNYEGVEIFESSLIAQNDATNWSGAMFEADMGGALGIANWWNAGARGVPEGVLPSGFLFEFQRWPRDGIVRLFASARYGTTITHPAKIREVIFKKAS